MVDVNGNFLATLLESPKVFFFPLLLVWLPQLFVSRSLDTFDSLDVPSHVPPP